MKPLAMALALGGLVGAGALVAVVARAKAKKQSGGTDIVPPPPDAVWLKPDTWSAEPGSPGAGGSSGAPSGGAGGAPPTGSGGAPGTTGAGGAPAWKTSSPAGATLSLDAVAFLDERFAAWADRPTRSQLGRLQQSFTRLGVQEDGKIYARPEPTAYAQAIELAGQFDTERAPKAVGLAVRDFATSAYKLLPIALRSEA